MKKAFLLFCFISLWASKAQATDIFIKQASSGAANGTSCTDARANSSLVAGDWVPGNRIRICATLTGPDNGSVITALGSGTLGNPITILFEPGAIVQSPSCGWWNGGAACIYLSNRSYITVDGDITGGQQGIIQNTDSGSLLGKHHNSTGIAVANTTGIVVKNLQINNLYIHSGNECGGFGDPNGGDYGVELIASGGSAANNFLATNIKAHDVRWGISVWGTNVEIKNYEVYNFDHGVTIGPNGTYTGSILVHDSHFHDQANWDVTANCYHHDAIHAFGDNGAVHDVQIYNDLFDGDQGIHVTAFIYMEGAQSCAHQVTNSIIFNSVFVDNFSRDHNLVWWDGNCAGNTGNGMYNNFISATGANALLIRTETGFSSFNNIQLSHQGDVGVAFGTTHLANGWDNNIYEDTISDYGTNNTFSWNAGPFGGFGQWQSTCACDASGKFDTAAHIHTDATGHLLSGSIAIGAGKNLTYLGIAALNKDKNGVARPSSGSWDAGAYNFGGTTAGLLLTPNPVVFGSSVVGVSAPLQTITVLSNGTAPATLGNPIVTRGGANPTVFVDTGGGSCVVNATMAQGVTCTLIVQATPSAIGAQTAFFNVGANTSAATNLTVTGAQVSSSSFITAPTTWNFGSPTIHTPSADKLFTLTNNGNTTLTLTSPFTVFSGPFAADWSLGSGAPPANNCGAVGFTVIAPGGSCSKLVKVTPSTSGPETATVTWSTYFPYTLTATQSGANMNYSLTGGSPVITSVFTIPVNPVPTVVDPGFGFAMNHPVSGFTFNGVADSTIDVLFYKLTVGGAFGAFIGCCSSDYVLTGPQLYSGSEATPTMLAGTFNLSVPGPSATANLSVTGAAPTASVLLSPRALRLADTIQGVISPAGTLVLTNTGSATVTLSPSFLSITGALAADFSSTTGAVPCSNNLSIPAGGTCNIYPRATPSGVTFEQVSYTVNTTSSATDTVTVQIQGLPIPIGPAPVPILIASQIDFFPALRVVLTGKNFVIGKTQVLIDGVPKPTVCVSATYCVATLPASAVLLPGFGLVGHLIGVK